MAYILPQVALQRVIQEGIAILKQNPAVLDDIFKYYTHELMENDYGQTYIDQIKTWFVATKIPVVQAWSMSLSQVPQVSIQLAQEAEAEDKAAMGDHWGEGDTGTVGVNVFNVTLDVMLFGTKNSDEVLWLYYMVNYILFKRKRVAEDLGLQLGTFSATDYARDMPKLPENIWVRTIKYRALTENMFDGDPYLDLENLELNLSVESSNDEEGDFPVEVEVD